MTDRFACDHCGATIDTSADVALIVGLHRGVDHDEWGDEADELVSGEQLTFRYCDQSHLATHMERAPLPARVMSPEDDTSSSFVFSALFYVLGASVLAVWLYGMVSILRDVF